MPITFGELVQEVINEVRAKEQAWAVIQAQDKRIKELETQIAEAAKVAAAKVEEPVVAVVPVTESIVREPDKTTPKLVATPLPKKE
jgi:23S rRNA maturation mini-RNase III